MNKPRPLLETSFLERQREKLLEARNELSSAINRDDDENRLMDLGFRQQTGEAEDQGQTLNLSEINRAMVDRLAQRRLAIERALAKIDDGTYGYSDVSGHPIPLARLQALPESTRSQSMADAGIS